MNKILFSVMLILISLSSVAQDNRVGINTDNPQAALDIKSVNENGQVLRVSTIPSDIEKDNNDFVFFVGKSNQDNNQTVYDLRKISLDMFAKNITNLVPSLNTIIITNNKNYEVKKEFYKNYPIFLKKEITNTNTSMYFHAFKENGIEILKNGEYNVTAFIGFNELKSFKNDLLVSIAIKHKGEKNYNNYKRKVISRSNNKIDYQTNGKNGSGVGVAFSFINNFKTGDRIRLHLSRTYSPKDTNITILPGGATLSVSRVSSLNK